MSLLTMIQGACDAIGITRPSAVVSSTDQQIRQLLALANDEGRELARRGDWPRLTKEQTFTTLAQAVQTGAVPDDFDHFVNGSMFNRSTNRQVFGPLSPQDWQREQANPSVSTVYDHFRVRGADILITPTPPAGETIAYEYVSLHWCQSSGGTEQSAWAADTDTGLLDENLMRLGVIWRFKQAKGFDYAEDMQTYERQVEKALGRAGGAAVLALNGRPLVRPLLAPNVPDGNWNQ